MSNRHDNPLLAGLSAAEVYTLAGPTPAHAKLLAAVRTFIAADTAFDMASTTAGRHQHALVRRAALRTLKQVIAAQVTRRPDPEPKRTQFIVHAVAQARAFNRSVLHMLREGNTWAAGQARSRRNEWLKSARTAKAGAKPLTHADLKAARAALVWK